MYMKLCIFFFGTVHCIVHLFRIRFEKPFLIAIGVLVLLTAVYSWPSNASISEYQELTSGPILFLVNALLPFALWIGLRWKGRNNLGSGGS
jgi:spore germination protein KB